MTVLAGGQVSDHAEGLDDALGQRTLAWRSRLLAAVVTLARSVDTAAAAAVALGWLPRLERVLLSVFSAVLRSLIWVFHSVPAVDPQVVQVGLDVRDVGLELGQRVGAGAEVAKLGDGLPERGHVRADR